MPEKGTINRMKRIVKSVLALALILAALMGLLAETAGAAALPGRIPEASGWSSGGPGAGNGAGAALQAKSRKKKNTPTPKPDGTPKPTAEEKTFTSTPVPEGPIIDPQGIADYLFSHDMTLPDNFITKQEARALGWGSTYRTVAEAAPGKSIGGDRFGNYEGQLPTKKGRKYFECDIDFDGTFRNGLRIIYSNDGLIYYTQDHYKTFERLY